MMSELEKYEWIERYLEGGLEGAELVQFEAVLEKDKAFRQLLETHRMTHQVIHEAGLLDVRNRLNKIHSEHSFLKGGNKAGINLAVASLLALAIGGGIWFFISQTEEEHVAIDPKEIELQEAFRDEKVPEDPANNSVPVLPDAHTISQNYSVQQPEEMETTVSDQESASFAQVQTKPDVRNTEESSRTLPKTLSVSPSTPDVAKAETEEDLPADPCEGVWVDARIEVKESCNNKPTGEISVIATPLSTATQSFRFSLDGVNYSDNHVFSNLSGGNYDLFIRDARECKEVVRGIYVDQKDCTTDFRIAPMHGEYWKIPIQQDAGGTLLIRDRNGIVVLHRKLDAGGQDNQWDGKDLNGSYLPMGSYPYTIYYTDGTSTNGTVTIIR